MSMFHRQRPVVAALFAFAVFLPLSVSAQNNLVDVLKKKYPVTQMTLNHSQVVQPGVTMDIQAHGINAEPVDTIITFDNPIEDGKVQQHAKVTSFFKSKNLMILKPGDKVYITKIEGKPDSKGDQLKFTLLSVDALDVDGGASQKHYSAVLTFKLQKDGLIQSSPDDAQRMIEAIMTPDSGDNGGDNQAAPQAPARGRAASGPPQTQAPAPIVQAAAAPAPAAPAATQTISMGQTPEQVIAIMGMPLTVVDLGAKKTYKYKDMKVLFVNGKVSDVQ